MALNVSVTYGFPHRIVRALVNGGTGTLPHYGSALRILPRRFAIFHLHHSPADELAFTSVVNSLPVFPHTPTTHLTVLVIIEQS